MNTSILMARNSLCILYDLILLGCITVPSLTLSSKLPGTWYFGKAKIVVLFCDFIYFFSDFIFGMAKKVPKS